MVVVEVECRRQMAVNDFEGCVLYIWIQSFQHRCCRKIGRDLSNPQEFDELQKDSEISG